MHDKNKTNITKHIMQIARRLPEFRCMDLIDAYFGKHHSDDWNERLGSLVARGKLYARNEPKGNSGTWNDNLYSLGPLVGRTSEEETNS